MSDPSYVPPPVIPKVTVRMPDGSRQSVIADSCHVCQIKWGRLFPKSKATPQCKEYVGACVGMRQDHLFRPPDGGKLTDSEYRQKRAEGLAEYESRTIIASDKPKRKKK